MGSPTGQKAEGNWKVFKGKLQEAWGDLTGDEVDRFEGNREQLEGHIERKTGEKRENIRKKIDKLANETKYKF